MKSFIFIIAGLLAFVEGIEIYSHLPLHTETYVRHEHGRARRNAGGVPANVFLPGDNSAHAGKKGGLIFPPHMQFTFTINGEEVTLHLKLNHKQLSHTPVTVFTNGVKKHFDDSSPRDYAYYQVIDGRVGATVMVRCPIPSEPCHLVGNVLIGGVEYRIEPSTHTPVEVPESVLHNIYNVPPADEHANSDDVLESILNDDGTIVPKGKGRVKRQATPILKENRREKRQTTPIEYEVELLMVVDCKVYEYWYGRLGDGTLALEEIKKYYEQLANSMDMRYSSVETSSMIVDVIPFEIYVMTTCSDSPWVYNMGYVGGTYCLKAYDALTDFETWVNAQTTIDPSVDAIQTYTREDLASSTSSGTAGLARMVWREGSTVSLPCLITKMALSIVEDGSYSGVERSSAHELGHNLGVSHDPIVGCSDTYKYTMSSSSSSSVSSSIALNPWKFSSCSISELSRTLSDNYNDGSLVSCLSAAEGSSYNATDYGRVLNGQTLGEIYSLDAQCQLRVGVTSSACTSSSSYPISNSCYNGLLCSSTSGSCTSGIKVIRVFAGSECAAGKWCEMGACVDLPATTTPAYCDQATAQTYEAYYESLTLCLDYTCTVTCPSGSDTQLACTWVQITNTTECTP